MTEIEVWYVGLSGLAGLISSGLLWYAIYSAFLH